MRASTSPASIARYLRRFARCERGAVMPLFLVSAAVIFGASLGGIDLARHASATTRLQNALDGAALAMGRLASSEQDTSVLLAEAQRYFEANFPADYQGSGIDAGKLSLSMNDSRRMLTLSVDGSLPLLSTGFLEVSAADLRAKSTVALEGNSNLEVVFAIDTSATRDAPATFATSLKDMGRELLERGQGSTHIGIVPYSEVVNVGSEYHGWVARWYQHASNDRISAGTPEYHRSHWTGCIAEPTPWVAPNIDSIDPLKPTADFLPVIARVETGLWSAKASGGPNNENHGVTADMNGAGWELTGTQSKHENIIKNVAQPESIRKIDSDDTPERLLWVDFHPGPGGSPHERFHLYSVHEPANCSSAAKVRYLDNDPISVPDALAIAAQLSQPDGQSKALPAAGLLWSWRMFSPEWRGNAGWQGSLSPKPGETAARATVIVTRGNNTAWDVLKSSYGLPGIYARTWANTPDNDFTFRLDYHTECGSNGGGCSKDSKFLRTHVHGSAPGQMKLTITNNGFQKPVSSLAMKDPFVSGPDIKFDLWPTVQQYTRQVCSALKADDINIFVLSPPAGMFNPSDMPNCASGQTGNKQVYAANQIEALREALLNLRSESSTLRLVPSS